MIRYVNDDVLAGARSREVWRKVRAGVRGATQQFVATARSRVSSAAAELFPSEETPEEAIEVAPATPALRVRPDALLLGALAVVGGLILFSRRR